MSSTPPRGTTTTTTTTSRGSEALRLACEAEAFSDVLCAGLGLVSREHREALKLAAGKRKVSTVPIDQIVHKTFLKVDELGAEAAAATGVTRCAGCVREPEAPVTFTADRPFVLAIRDSRTNGLLFVGQVTDPRP